MAERPTRHEGMQVGWVQGRGVEWARGEVQGETGGVTRGNLWRGWVGNLHGSRESEKTSRQSLTRMERGWEVDQGQRGGEEDDGMGRV